MTSPNAIDSFSEIATVRIELKGSEPPIWRVVEVPTSVTLKVLHDIIQVAMGWLDYHLWQFVIDDQVYGLPMEEDWGTAPRKVAARVRLRDVLSAAETAIDYTYDFGDDWQHRLVITDIRPGETGTIYPRFVAGERDCPPEDCGGIPGFYEMLEARVDPAHPDHAAISEWLDGYDPEQLDVFPIEIAMKRIAARRNAAAVRILKLVKS